MTGSRWRGRLAAVSWLRLIALVVPVALSAGLWLWQARALDSVEEAAGEDRAVVNAATALTSAWASVDHREIDEYVDTVRAGATGAFLEQFDSAEPLLREAVVANRSVQVPTIPRDGAALLERRDDQARVVIAMDAAVSNKRTERPQARQYRLLVSLEREDGRWLMSGLEFIDDAA